MKKEQEKKGEELDFYKPKTNSKLLVGAFAGLSLILACGGAYFLTKKPSELPFQEPVSLAPFDIETSCDFSSSNSFKTGAVNIRFIGRLENDQPAQIFEMISKGVYAPSRPTLVRFDHQGFSGAVNNQQGLVIGWNPQQPDKLYQEDASLQELDFYKIKVEEPLKVPEKFTTDNLVSAQPVLVKLVDSARCQIG